MNASSKLIDFLLGLAYGLVKITKNKTEFEKAFLPSFKQENSHAQLTNIMSLAYEIDFFDSSVRSCVVLYNQAPRVQHDIILADIEECFCVDERISRPRPHSRIEKNSWDRAREFFQQHDVGMNHFIRILLTEAQKDQGEIAYGIVFETKS